MKKLILLFLFTLTSLITFAQGVQTGGIFLRVTDSATYVNSTYVTTSHTNNYADIFYSVSSNLFWKWNSDTNLYELLSSGSGGWATSGTTPVTDPTINYGNGLLHFQGGEDGNFLVTLPSTGTGVSGIGDDAGLMGIGVEPSTGKVRLFSDGETKVLEVDPAGFLITTDEPIVINTDPGTLGYTLTSQGAGIPPIWAAGGTNTSSALTDGSTITITGPKHTLTSTQATITWTLSQTPDFQTTDIILNATSTTWTFPAGALCVVDGAASGTNTASLTGVSGDHHIMSIYKDGTNYRVVVKNFGQ